MQNESGPPEPALLDFAPVPRKTRRAHGWTPARQRDFIAALADMGSVTAAARRVGMSHATAYDLYNHPEGASFRRAWDAALQVGVRQLHDAAMERALTGVPVPIIHGGRQVGEKRIFNDHLLMQLLRHHAGSYGDSPVGRRSTAARERDAAENCPVCRDRRAAEAQPNETGKDDDKAKEFAEFIGEIEQLYIVKIKTERRDRLAGAQVAADFSLRQMLSLELALIHIGASASLDALWRDHAALFALEGDEERKTVHLQTADALAQLRNTVWAELGDPPRPHVPPVIGSTAMRGAANWGERCAAQDAAQDHIAAAQAEWEAAATEESWAAWKALHPDRY